MTKSAYPYPPDEFDVAVPGGAPVGVHRAPRSGWSSAWPFLLVAVVCAVVAWGVISFIIGQDGPADADTPTGTSTVAATDAPTDPSAAATDPAVSPSPEAPPAPDVAALMAAGDPAATIWVYNYSGNVATVDKLAAKTVGYLEPWGFTNAEPISDDAAEGADATANTIYYGENRANEAKAAAAILGIPEAQLVMSEAVTASPQALWVVMVTDVTPQVPAG
ncbi:LytR C-terminal domain-containing protein [Antribacter gilvus]|uniref:LytR C-terminal domain-containing protein n=1 Tax=Antribacter gilvus TaxID=2304675 RepID=UPI000F78F4FD|nr:LytR C-terminal domain-containing protein [Antribacter gilvus]